MPDPEAVARELDALAEQQTGPERGELISLSAEIKLNMKRVRLLLSIAAVRIAEIREAAEFRELDELREPFTGGRL